MLLQQILTSMVAQDAGLVAAHNVFNHIIKR